MTNRITEARRALAESIVSPSAEVLPRQINTPTFIGFAPAPDYLAHDGTFGGGLEVNLSAFALVKSKNDLYDVETLDDLLIELTDAARVNGWGIERVDEPDVLKYGDWSMYGTRITLTISV